MRDWPQFLIAFLCNVGVLNFGLQTGWLSPLQPSLQSNDSNPLGPDVPALDDEQISWVGSLPSITLVIAAPLFGFCLDQFGRRFTIFLATAPNLLTFTLLIFANNVYIVYASRIIGGFCSCGAFIASPMYINETVMPKYKGPLGSLGGFYVKVGIILAFVFGSYTSYLTLNLICLSTTVIFLIAYPWMPESPVYLLSKGKWLEAEDSLRKLWGAERKEDIENEIKMVQNRMINTVTPSKSKVLKQFLTKPHLRKAAIIVLCIFSFQMFSGYPAIMRYTVDIFQRAGTSYSSHMAAIFMATAQLVFALFGSIMIDRLGRKTLVVYSLLLMSASLACVAVYLVVKQHYPDLAVLQSLRYLPTVALLCFIGLYGAAFGTVPFVIIPELFAPETRAMASTVLNLLFAVVEFIVVKTFPPLTNIINLYGTLGIFALFGLLGSVVMSIIMFETKGLDMERVQMKLKGNIAVLNYGLQAGWLSPLQPFLQSNGSNPLGPDVPALNDEQISWVGALPSITLVIAGPIFGICVDRFGRRFTLFLATAPNLLTFTLLIFANNVYIVYASRLIGGFCSCGSFIVSPMYINETVMPKYKGPLGSSGGFYVNLGIILAFVFGSYTSYSALNLMSLSTTVIFLIAYPWIPESPIYFLSKGNWLEAEAALIKLWGPDRQVEIENELKMVQKRMENTVTPSTFKVLKQFITKPYLRKAAIIVMGVFSFQVLCGYSAIVRYTVDIFQRAGTTYSSHLAAIFMATTQLLFALFGAAMMDRLGRKTLIVYSLLLMSACLAAVSAYLIVKQEYPDLPIVESFKYLPTVALLSFIALYGASFGSVPFVIIPELFAAETRAMASTVLNLWFSVVEFVVVKTFTPLTNVINLYGTLGIFSAICLVGSVIMSIIMFETKGLNMEKVQMKLRGEDVQDKMLSVSVQAENLLLDNESQIGK